MTGAVEEFEDRYAFFVNSWAEAKGEVPQPQVVFLRSMRHQCKNKAFSISSNLLLLTDLAKEGNGKDIPKIIRLIGLKIEELLEMLDQLFAAVNAVRAQHIEEVFLASEPL